MHVDEQIKGEIAIVSLKGELLDNADEFLLQQKINSLRSDGITKLVFDLGKINRINSTGLSALIAAVKMMRTHGGDIRLAQIDRHLNDILVKTRLVQVFNTFETVGRAMASYQN